MLQALITSKTRIKLLMKFFLNSRNTSYLRDLANEFGESTNAIRLELNHLEKANLLRSKKSGNKKLFQANRQHPLFDSIHQMLLRHTGIEQFVDTVVRKLGGLKQAYVVGSFARGVDHPVIDVLLVGSEMDKAYLLMLIEKAEGVIERRIRYMLVDHGDAPDILKNYPEALLLWDGEKKE